MQNSHYENVSPQQQASNQNWPQESLRVGRSHSNVLKESSGINRNHGGHLYGVKDGSVGCFTEPEPYCSTSAYGSQTPSTADLPADWNCVFVRDASTLATYVVGLVFLSLALHSPATASTALIFCFSTHLLFQRGLKAVMAMHTVE